MSEAPSPGGRPAERWLRYLAVAVLVLVGIVLLWSRLIHLDVSLWHDEAESILIYNDFGTLISKKSSHVLFNLLSWVTTEALGTSEAVQRLWSVVPALGAVALAAWWAWRRIGPVTAIVFAVLAMANPLHLDLAAQARGYGLGLLAGTLMLIAADTLTRRRTAAIVLGFLGAGLLGIWTLIFFAFAFVGQALSLLWWPQLRRMALVTIAAVALLSLAFYLPVLDSGNGDFATAWNGAIPGEQIPFGGALFLERSLEWLVIPTFTILGGPESGTAVTPRAGEWADPLALFLLVLGLVAVWQRRDAGLGLLLIVPPLVFNLSFSLLGMNTTARHQLVLMTHVLMLVAIGIAWVGTLAAGNRILRPIVIAAGLAAVLVLSRETIREEQARALPFENFKGVAQVVRGTGIDTVVTDSSRPTGLVYYLGDELEVLSPAQVEDLLCDRGQGVVYIRHLPVAPGFPGYRKPADLECAMDRRAARVTVPQRGRGGGIDVWIAPGAGGESGYPPRESSP